MMIGETMTKLFPTILIGLMTISGVLYFYEGDWRKGIYWIAAGVLNAAVTY